MQAGKIIYLNGVSSAGKTSIARELQRLAEEPFYWVPIDMFFDMGPARFWESDDKSVFSTCFFMCHALAAEYARQGYHVILDNVLIEDERAIMYDALLELNAFDVTLVHVDCDVEELRRREAARGDRRIGQAEYQHARLLPKAGYDITVNTAHAFSQDCARRILEEMQEVGRNEGMRRFLGELKE